VFLQTRVQSTGRLHFPVNKNMSTTPEQERRLENFRAQYNTILNDIYVANHQIEQLLERKKEILSDVDRMSINKKQLVKELGSIVSKKESLERSIVTREKAISKREENSVNRIKESLRQLDVKTRSIEHEVGARVGILEKSIVVLEEQESKLNQTIKGLESRASELSESISLLTKESLDLEEKIEKMESESHERLFSVEKQIGEKELELDKLASLTETEKEKIQLPQRLLEERQQMLDERERVLLTLERRLKDLFKRHFPHISLPSSLQHEIDE